MRNPISAPRPSDPIEVDTSDRRFDWSWHEYPIDSPAQAFDVFEPIVDAWRARGPGIPRWRDFEFTDFRGWHGRINLLEVLPSDPIAFRVRLMGTTFVTLFGEDCTGRRVAPGVGGFLEDDEAHLTWLVEGPRIGRTAGPMDWRDRSHVLVDLLYLPVSSDGRRIDRLMECGNFPTIKT